MSNFNCYHLCARRDQMRGRPSGGVVVLIGKTIQSLFTKISGKFRYGLEFKIDKDVFGKPVIFMPIYLPPYGSKVYGPTEDNGVEILEEEILRLKTQYADFCFLISGDMNARTKNIADFLIDDQTQHVPLPESYDSDYFNLSRNSRDLHGDINNHGKALIKLCCYFNMHMLNGRTEGDMDGNLTCFTSNGSSLVDYTLASTDLFPSVRIFEIGENDHYTHLPQTFRIGNSAMSSDQERQQQNRDQNNQQQQFCNPNNTSSNPDSSRTRAKFRWDENQMESISSSAAVEHIYEKLEVNNIDGAISDFTEMLQTTSKKVVPKKLKDTERKQTKWWDEEMETLKRNKIKSLRLLRIENSAYALNTYRNIRKLYREKIREKKEAYNRNIKILIESCKSGTEFWKVVKSVSKSKSCANKVTQEDWTYYFNTLLNNRSNLEKDFEQEVSDYIHWHDINCTECSDASSMDVDREISLGEVENAIDETVASKAPGLDGITNDIIKKGKTVIIPILCDIYNKILETGQYPSNWGEAIIVPIHKAGDVNNPSNYRGIALLSCISKVFMKILNNRLQVWAMRENKLHEEQAGFTKGKRTVDQIFILQSLVSKYLSKKGGRFYSVFIDFSKAFDTVPHLHLFYSFIKGGLHGKVFRVIRNMYSKLTSCIQYGEGKLSESFSCNIGTRQGCMLSPFMFIFYLNEIITMSTSENCRGIYIDAEHSVNMLLYADDIVFVGDSIGSVQKLLNVLSEFCNKWGLKVNIEKTKFMVLRNGGIIKGCEKVYLNGTQLSSVSYYKYLGLLLSSRLNWHKSQVTLACQAMKALNCINTLMRECDFSYMSCCSIFDKCALPVLTYGAEIWGMDVYSEIEDVLIKFCRRQLGVGTRSIKPAVLGECGRFGIHIECKIKCVKYWFRLLSQPDNSLLKSCYDMLLTQCSVGRKNWASRMKDMLYEYGYGYVWEAQGVPDTSIFLHDFKARLQDCERQEWRASLMSMSKMNLYCMVKSELVVEQYLLLDIPRHYKRALAKLRVGNNDLEVEKGRYENTRREERLCKFCKAENVNAVEDAYHVTFECALYNDIRGLYVDVTDANPHNLFSFRNLFSSRCENVIYKLSQYAYYMFKQRNLNMEVCAT